MKVQKIKLITKDQLKYEANKIAEKRLVHFNTVMNQSFFNALSEAKSEETRRIIKRLQGEAVDLIRCLLEP